MRRRGAEFESYWRPAHLVTAPNSRPKPLPCRYAARGGVPDANIALRKLTLAWERSSGKSTPQGGEAKCGMGAGVAHGERAHLLAVNEGVHAVLPVHCDAARSTHCHARLRVAGVGFESILRCPQNTTESARGELAVPCEPNRSRIRARC